jgi:tRNA(fMet)-specific endonuclease VapC
VDQGREARSRFGATRGTTLVRLILDTTVLIDAERDDEALDRLIGDRDDLAIAAVTAAELLVGVELADKRRRKSRERYAADVLVTIPIESYDLHVARAHARLLAHVRHSGSMRGAHDLIIAATAVAREREIVSADAKAFEGLPGVVLRGV